jgi:REP element-mobilizing transposase RayT
MPQSKLNIYIHFVWATWDRHPLISEEDERELHRYIVSTSHNKKCEVLAIGGMVDHIHLLVKLPGDVTVSDFMEQVKGSSSRWMVMRRGEERAFKWQGGYGAFSVSPHDRRRVMDYIQNQKQHHADNRLWPESEKIVDD